MTYDQPRVSLLRWTAAGAAFAAVLTPVLLLGLDWVAHVVSGPTDGGVVTPSSELGGALGVLQLVLVGVSWGAVVAFVTALVVNYRRDPRAGTRAPSPEAADRPGEPAQR